MIDSLIVKRKLDSALQEIEVTVKYADYNHDVERILTLLESLDARIPCSCDSGQRLISIPDIYYIESVDKKTFVYCEKEVYQTDLRLYQVLEILNPFGFVKISKSCILNLRMLDAIKPLANSKMEATLKNSERLSVNRRYLTAMKKALQEGIRL